jgi:hypothetical protein
MLVNGPYFKLRHYLNLRVPRRILPPFSSCGMPRIDIGRTEVYGFRLAGDEVSVPCLFSRNHWYSE